MQEKAKLKHANANGAEKNLLLKKGKQKIVARFLVAIDIEQDKLK